MENRAKTRTIIRYSQAFKMKVVSDIESGKYTTGQARKVYGIGGAGIIQNWIKKFGKLELLNKIVRIQMKDEQSVIKQLEKEKHELESALAQAHIKILAYESLISVAEKNLGMDLKKNFKPKQSAQPKSKQKNKKKS